MFYNLIALAAVAAAAPVVERAAVTDVQILNYALTLEHLENAFYKMGTEMFNQAQFTAAGAGPAFYEMLTSIASDEATHVQFLSGALGDQATQPCNYSFGVTDAKSFLQTSSILEGVGVSAYLGAAQFISNPDYLTAAGSILTVEARHSGFVRRQLKASGFPSPFDIPLDFDNVYSLAVQFITGCPDSNPTLPVKAFPALAASPATPAMVGDKITLTSAKKVGAKAAWFFTILGPVQAPLTGSGKTYSITVPEGVQQGQEYVVLTKNMQKPTDSNIVAGPAIVMIADKFQTPAPSGQ